MTLLRDIPLEEVVRKYSIKNFVETGAWIGLGLETAFAGGIQNCYSCDIDRAAARVSKQKVPSATVWHSKSDDFLNGILPDLKGATLFWLDAHFPEDSWIVGNIQEASKNLPYDSTPDWRIPIEEAEDFPLFKEIMLIKDLKEDYQNDIILIDDLHVFQDEENPHRNELVNESYKQFGKWRLLMWLFSDTHDFSVVNVGEKVGMWLPKEAVDNSIETDYTIEQEQSE